LPFTGHGCTVHHGGNAVGMLPHTDALTYLDRPGCRQISQPGFVGIA
jgi:hypothetical protein